MNPILGIVDSEIRPFVWIFALVFAVVVQTPAESKAAYSTEPEDGRCAAIVARPAPSSAALQFSLIGSLFNFPTARDLSQNDLQQSIQEYTQQNQAADSALSANNVRGALAAQRRALAASMRLYGPEEFHVYTQEVLVGWDLSYLDDQRNAVPLLEHAYIGLKRTKGDDGSWTRFALHVLSGAEVALGRCHQLLGLVESPSTPVALAVYSWSDKQQTQWASDIQNGYLAFQESDIHKATSLFKDAMDLAELNQGRSGARYSSAKLFYAIAIAFGGDAKTGISLVESATADPALNSNDDVAASILPLITSLMLGMQQYEAVDLVLERRAADFSKKVNSESASLLANLASALWALDRHADAEKWAYRALVIARTNPSVSLSVRYQAETTYASILAGLQRYSEAEQVVKRLLDEKSLPNAVGNDDLPMERAHLAERMAVFINYDPTSASGIPYAASALDYFSKPEGASIYSTVKPSAELDVQNVLASSYLKERKFDAAVDLAKDTCAALEEQKNSALARDGMLKMCRYNLAIGYSGMAREASSPFKLNAFAFKAAQSAQSSSAGQALAYARARESGGSRAKQLAGSYDDAVSKAESLDRQYETSVGNVTEAKLARLIAERDAAGEKIRVIAKQIDNVFPGYWDIRAPAPVSIESLQAKTGSDAQLLRDDEALIYFVLEGPTQRGVVFAVSKGKSVSAEISMGHDEIKFAVKSLRDEIDACSYSATAGNCRAKKSDFSRMMAYRLYQALLGSAAVQEVISPPEIKTLLFVPTGILTTLPPGVLITSRPVGRDDDPVALRNTQWLLRSKAIAVLPTVSSLRLLRARKEMRHARSDLAPTLVAFANPNFSGGSGLSLAPRHTIRSGTQYEFQSYFRMGEPNTELLRSLPPLPGTVQEVDALRRVLGAPQSSVHLGNDASEATLHALQADGQLENADVIEFATHGLIAGNIMGLAQPALVLAAPGSDETPTNDGLLTAAEAASLHISADWVVLSACNTAAPDAPEAQGLSGLASGFFKAGARSLLVSHWRVEDDAAAVLVPDVFLRSRADPALSKAEALREASLAILDDSRRDNFAFPSAWAAFVLVGDPAR